MIGYHIYTVKMQMDLLGYFNIKGPKGYHMLLSVSSVIVFSISFFASPMPYFEANGYNSVNGTEIPTNDSDRPPAQTIQFGAWASHQIPLEQMTDPIEMKNAIGSLLNQGYTEYYFPIVDYESELVEQNVEDLLTATDNTTLKMFAILLPPSEAGENGNYDWDGWIGYLNSLKESHPSFHGFVMDDFNWFMANEGEEGDGEGEDKDDSEQSEDENVREAEGNVEYMIDSDLEKALQSKRKDLNFYPVIYFEGIDTNDAKRHFFNYTDGVVLATPAYYNVTDLEENLKVFSKVFDNKSVKYVLYTARNTAFIEQGYNPPSDRLILATLSIANKTGTVDGIVVWRNSNNHAIRDYISNQNNAEYILFVNMMEKLQLKDEDKTSGPGIFSSGPPSEKNGDNENNDSSERPTVWLGIEGFDFDTDLAEEMSVSKDVEGGMVIQSVVPNGPAHKAGLKDLVLDVDNEGYLTRKGDIITSADGEKIDGSEDIVEILKEKQPGDLLELSINRNGQLINKTIAMESIPK